MATTQKNLYLRTISNSPNELFIDFEYFFDDKLSFCNSFLRPLNESLELFLKRVKTKLTQLKYTKSSKKIKNSTVIHTCEIKITNSNHQFESVLNLSLQDMLKKDFYIHINNCTYKKVLNPPWIINCSFQKVFMENCPSVPKIEIRNGTISDVNIQWFINKNQTNDDWKFLQSSFVFVPHQSHVNHYVKALISTRVDIKSQQFCLISREPIKYLPQTDYQLTLSLGKLNLTRDENVFRLCTYNILASFYSDTKDAHDRLYRHCKPIFLDQSYRQCLIMKEILEFKSDLILLQEVDFNFFSNTLFPTLNSFSFDGIHETKSGNVSEGGAIFWNTDIFSFVRNISISNISSQLIDSTSDLCRHMASFLSKDDKLWKRWQSLSHCMTGVVLKYKKRMDDMFLIVVNNHLFYHPHYEILRLYQIALVIFAIQKIKDEYPCAVVLLGGDFNASYEDATIQFVLDGSYQCQHNGESLDLTHELGILDSAFKDKLEFTNFTPDYIGILDHIFYDRKQVTVSKVYDVPSRADIESHIALPNKYHPSDHLPLTVDFILS